MSKSLNRRWFLEGAAYSLAAAPLMGTSPAFSQASWAATVQSVIAEGQRIDAALVVEAARMLSRRPMVPVTTNDLPEGYATLPFDQFSG
ncbi:hypothetical protein AB4156_44515, partial [Cupriavidus sp. 2MCAB6]|uniref:hypothetical protein n=1 Tax=Cupriavidus sp. 2MCAB6 TaxID=3232981 RepID=UPI003F91BD5B